MLLDLPLEISQKIFTQVPNELKLTCRAFYNMYNNQYFQLLTTRFDDDIINKIKMNDFQYLINYIKSFEYWRKESRMIIARTLELPMPDYNEPSIECQFIRDSWKLIYGIYINKRIFLDYKDYKVEDGEFQRSININKEVRLVPGLYNLSVGLILKNNNGLNGTVFKIANESENLLEYTPASNFGELVPHNRFVLLDMGSFEIKKPSIEEIYEEGNKPSKMQSIRLIVEEIGMLVKSAFVLCYIDINAYQLKDSYIDDSGSMHYKNEKYWIAWWIENQLPKPENVVNVLFKRLSKSIDKWNSGGDEIEDIGDDSGDNNRTEDGDNGHDDDSDDDAVVDLDTYNLQFYNPRNENGDIIRRVFKFYTQRDRLRYDEWENERSEKVYKENEPLKWKMTTIMDI